MMTRRLTILRHTKPGMLIKHLYQKFSIPQPNRAMRKRRAAKLTRKRPLNSTKFILQILSLLAERAFAGFGSDGFNGIAHTFYAAGHAIGDDGEVGGEGAVVVDHEDVFEVCG